MVPAASLPVPSPAPSGQPAFGKGAVLRAVRGLSREEAQAWVVCPVLATVPSIASHSEPRTPRAQSCGECGACTGLGTCPSTGGRQDEGLLPWWGPTSPLRIQM